MGDQAKNTVFKYATVLYADNSSKCHNDSRTTAAHFCNGRAQVRDEQPSGRRPTAAAATRPRACTSARRRGPAPPTRARPCTSARPPDAAPPARAWASTRARRSAARPRACTSACRPAATTTTRARERALTHTLAAHTSKITKYSRLKHQIQHQRPRQPQLPCAPMSRKRRSENAVPLPDEAVALFTVRVGEPLGAPRGG